MGEACKLEYQTKTLKAFKNNNPVIFKALYVSNYHKVESLVLKNSGSMEYAKYIYQDAFTKTWKDIKSYKFTPQNEIDLQDYLYQIAKNNWKEVSVSKSLKKTNSSHNYLEILEQGKCDNNIGENILERQTMDAYKKLEQPCKKVLRLFYFDKKTLEDIAGELNIPESTVRNKKYSCMEKLRAMMITQNN
ncbi:RNA polymerase sigma factor [Mariniflexile ostreae]|uniref:RNA polymerase sigma factor n=1 Tax=Mariniflexile ostreae TaxID=1520892 RepID=A0ABV5FBD0_9FLAO